MTTPSLLLRSAASALALAAGLAALAPGAASAAETVYRMAVRGEPKSLDPHRISGSWENYIAGDAFLGLLTDAADSTPIPGAAESWTISDDGLTYTFKIRDHQWSDGQKVTAEDFVFAMRRLLAPEFAGEYAYLLHPIKNAQKLNAGEMKGMENLGVRAVDPATLEITLEHPTGYFLELLTHYTSFAVPRHVVEREGDDWIKPGKIVSNGAYRIVEWTPNSRVVSERNPNFYDAANVKIDRVIYYPDEDGNAVTKRFRAGEIDYVHEFPSEQIEFLRKELPTQTRVYPHLGTYYYTINNKRKPFDDVRVREALSLAVDRSAIVDRVLKTGEIAAYGVVPPKAGTYGDPYVPAWAQMGFKERQDRAKALLAETGHGPDNPLKLELSYNTSENHKRIAVAVQAMMKQVGVQAELVNREVKVHYDLLEQNQFDVARAAWVADYNDPENFLGLLETSTGVKNYGRFNNADFDRLMEESAAERDQAKRNALMRQAEQVAIGQHAWIPIYYYVSKVLLSDKVEGFVENTKQTHRTRWLSLKQ